MTQLIKKLSEPKILLTIAISYTLFVTVLFLMPAGDLPSLPTLFNIKNFDKIVHISLHSILAFVWLRFIYARKMISLKNTIGYMVLACVLYGIVIEAVQYILNDGRNADVWDVLANFTGSLLGLAMFYSTKKKLIA